jgi:hypothetical protein
VLAQVGQCQINYSTSKQFDVHHHNFGYNMRQHAMAWNRDKLLSLINIVLDIVTGNPEKPMEIGFSTPGTSIKI